MFPVADTEHGVLGDLVRKVEQQVEAGETVSIGLIQDIAGQRAGGPMLLLPALLVVSPLSIIPGLPTLVGINTILVAGQLALGKTSIWLPHWLSERCISGKHARKLMGFLGPVSAAADKVVKPRARPLVGKIMRRGGAIVCVLVGALMPVMEFVPFTSTWAGVVIAAYALAITARDGLLATAWAGLVFALILLGWALLT
jgi:hypothetical protein